MSPYISSLNIKGFKPFRDTTFNFGWLEVIAGANGSGKSSLFEFLQFLRDAVDREIPPEIVKGSVGQQIFHANKNDFMWKLGISNVSASNKYLSYSGYLVGPKGKPFIKAELLYSGKNKHTNIFELTEGSGYFIENNNEKEISLRRLNQLFLSTVTNQEPKTLYLLRYYIGDWRFYSSFTINSDNIRKSVLIEQNPILHEDAGNLSAVLFYLMTEHKEAFEKIEFYLQSLIPGFNGLKVKARGAPGEIIAFSKENGIDQELTLADLSYGILRLICWVTLCIQPNPPSLICIDEPDQGVHPRTLPILASLFEKASERTQILLATHSSYFLSQFDISRIAVMKKENGEALYLKPKDSKTLTGMLGDFGPDELEIMHRSDELETFS